MDDILEGLEGITPGEWKFCGCGKCGLIWSHTADCLVAVSMCRKDEDYTLGDGCTEDQRDINALAISRVPALIAEIRKLREEDSDRCRELDREAENCGLRVMVLKEALRPLLECCEDSYGVPDDGDEDDEFVGTETWQGKIRRIPLTFGDLRRARQALTPPSAPSGTEP